MLEKFKYSLIPLTIAASIFVSSSQVLAVNSSKQSTPPGQLRSCQVRELAIKNRMSHLTRLATDMVAKFDTHAAKVENFYTTKVLPGGKTVTNYDSLVSDISNKKAAVQTALTKAQNDVNGFNCDSNPKAQMTLFRQDMQSVKKVLKDYRASIKNLIVAVKTNE